MRRPSPADLLDRLPEAHASLVGRVLEAADAEGVAVYAIGGPVRDLLLQRPLRDVDLLVDGSDAAALARKADDESDLRVVAHERFGTATLRGAGAEVDLAGARRETYPHDGALPDVAPGGLENDLARRDFGVNALALPLSAKARAAHAGVVAPPGALDDLAARRLRVLHPRSFHDDPTRALRAARLAPRLGFTLARDSRAALRAALRDGAFGRVSGERLRREFAKVFDDAALGLDPSRALRLLADWHVLGALEPGLALDREAVAPLRRIGRAVAEPPWPAGRWRPWVSGLAVWLAPLTPALRRRALGRLAVRGDHADAIAGFPKARDGWLRALSRSRGRGAVDEALLGVDEERLHALHAWAPPPLRRRIGRWADEDRRRGLPIDGDDLVELGLSGPALGRALRRIRTQWLDGAVGDRAEALALARELSRRARGGKSERRR